MKRLTALFLSLLLLLTLSACIPEEEETVAESGYGLWFAVDRGSSRADSAAAVCREVRDWHKTPNAHELMQALLEGPQSDGLQSPFPPDVSVHFISIDEEDQTIWVDLSEQYNALSGFDLTVADYCIAMTLCQLPEVETVKVTVEGESISSRNRQTLQPGDVLLSGIEEEPDTFLAALYFPDRSGGTLTVEYRQVTRTDGRDAVEIVMDELLRGPVDDERSMPMPDGTRVRSLAVRDGVCHVDLSEEFMLNIPQTEEKAGLTLYALVNTLCVRSGVTQVQLLIEGESVETYGNVSVDAPLSANFDLVAN